MQDLALQLEWVAVAGQCSHLHEIRRSLMPQIKTGDMVKAFDMLRQHARVSKGSASVGSLKQLQRDIDWKKVDGIVDRWKKRGQDPNDIKPVVVSKDRSIVDGHHRWAAIQKGWGKDARVPIWQIGLAAEPALKLYMSVAKKFAEGLWEEIEVLKQLKKRRYEKHGYELRYEIWKIKGDDSDPDGTPITVAYTLDGDYIGDSKTAYFLCVKRGIKPEKISAGRNVCSIGFCEKEQKWYGWSHRAIYGFKVGDVQEKGSAGEQYLKPGFKAKTLEDAKKMAIAFARGVS